METVLPAPSISIRTPCPGCGTSLDDDADDGLIGDVIVCLNCATVLQLDDDLITRKAPASFDAHMRRDPAFRAWSDAVRKRARKNTLRAKHARKAHHAN